MTIEEQAIQYWKECLAFIKDNMVGHEVAFESWFRPIKPIKFEKNEMTLEVGSLFIYEYLEEHYAELISAAFDKVIGKGTTLSYSVLTDQSNNISMNLMSDPQQSHTQKAQAQTGLNKAPNPNSSRTISEFNSQLLPNYSFSNLIEGDSNKLAISIGKQIAETPARTFNPFFIHGASGVGKTHLVNAIGLELKKTHPNKRVLYVSARLFYQQYSDAALNNKTNDFINFYQRIDALIIDDVQEFASYHKTQATFFHIFNHLKENGKQLIMTCDRPPSELQGINDRLLTRFKWGAIIELERPDAILRKNILKYKIKKEGLNISESVIDYIATNVNEGVRELEGIVNSLLVHSTIQQREIDLAFTQEIVKKVVKIAEVTPTTIDKIIEKVCEYYEIDLKSFNAKTRKQNIVEARQVCMYLASKHTPSSLATIGKAIGGKNYSTVIYSCKAIKNRVEVDRNFCDELRNIEMALLHS